MPTDLPSWALDALLAILAALAKLISAPDDATREEALMEAAEATKRALDAKKFGKADP